jgi:hypothetical protein
MVADRTDAGELSLQVRVDAKPSAMIFKNSVRSELHAFVCASCGFVEFYVDDPKTLYDAFLASQHNTPETT